MVLRASTRAGHRVSWRIIVCQLRLLQETLMVLPASTGARHHLQLADNRLPAADISNAFSSPI